MRHRLSNAEISEAVKENLKPSPRSPRCPSIPRCPAHPDCVPTTTVRSHGGHGQPWGCPLSHLPALPRTAVTPRASAARGTHTLAFPKLYLVPLQSRSPHAFCSPVFSYKFTTWGRLRFPVVVYQLDYRRSQRKTRILHRNEAWKAAPQPHSSSPLSPIPPPVITPIPTLPIPAAETLACSRKDHTNTIGSGERAVQRWSVLKGGTASAEP